MAKLYPRNTLRRTLKAHQPKYRLSRDVDILVHLDYLLFIQRLLHQAHEERKQEGDRTLRGTHVAKVSKVRLVGS
jgi:hypothetical protein